MKVSNNAASSCSISTDRKDARAGDINKLADRLIEVSQGVSKMVVSFNDPRLSNMQKTMLAEQSKPLLTKMADGLTDINSHKAESPNGSNLYNDFKERQLDSYAKKVQADFCELKNLSNNYEKNGVKFTPDTKGEDGGRAWNEKTREWE